MNEEQFKGHWNEMKGKLKERWGRLTDDELTQIGGRRDQLLGKIQVKYGIAKERAENELNRFLDGYTSSNSKSAAPSNKNSNASTDPRMPAATQPVKGSFDSRANVKDDVRSDKKDALSKQDAKKEKPARR